MEKSIEFRTNMIRRFIGSIDQDTRKYLELALDEIDTGKLTRKTIEESADSTILAWDIYLLGLIGTSVRYCDLFKNNAVEDDIDRMKPAVAMQKLKWRKPETLQAARKLGLLIANLHGSSLGTMTILITGRTRNPHKSLSLFWHHPDLWESDAVKLLKSWTFYSQAELAGR